MKSFTCPGVIAKRVNTGINTESWKEKVKGLILGG